MMSLNRFLTVVFQKEKLFTRACCWRISIVVYVVGFTLAYFSDYVISCCTAFIHYKVFSYKYTENGTNYVNTYIDIPLNFASSSLCFVMYFVIFIYVHKTNRANVGISSATASIRRVKEVRYAIQFAICSLFACLAWVSFRVFPLTIPPDMPEFYSFTAQCLILHCTANSLVFLVFNQEFKAKYFGQLSSISQVRAVNSMTTNNTPNQQS
uniref:7TM_GPCR_Srx domain-containing protein n=1 Tax=Panagrellus redivivus TaxID=6233 RepID=A0A7E4ZY86_PANRE